LVVFSLTIMPMIVCTLAAIICWLIELKIL
jgi:hypothetical protein